MGGMERAIPEGGAVSNNLFGFARIPCNLLQG